MQTEPRGPETASFAHEPALAAALVDALRTTRLTVLVGAGGAGKTRLLQEGVRPLLRRRSDDGDARPPPSADPGGVDLLERRRHGDRTRELVVWCDRWGASPDEDLHASLDAALGLSSPETGLSRAPIALRAAALGAERGARLLFVFDHGDRLTAESADRPGPAADYDALIMALCDAAPSVHLLVGTREDRMAASLRSRIERQEARVLRLPDPRPAGPAPVPPIRPASSAALSEGWRAAPAPTDRPLRREDVYESIFARLSVVDGGVREPPWGGEAAVPPRAEPAPVFMAPVESLSRSQAGLRLAGLVLLVVGAVGLVRWQDRSAPALRPAASAGPAAMTARLETPVFVPVESPSGPVAAAAVPPEATEMPGPSHAATSDSGTQLEDELWRALAVPRTASGGDPALASNAGRRLAIVPYDALRRVAAESSTARVIAPLYTEALQVIVRADSPLEFIHQIAGSRLDVGPAQSRRQQTVSAFYETLFDKPLRSSQTRRGGLEGALGALLRERSVDAVVLPEAQPSAWLAGLSPAERRAVRLLRLAPDDASTRRALRSYLPATLHVGSGASMQDVPTLAEMTFLVVDPALGGPTAANVAQTFCQALPVLRRDGHPQWRGVDPSLRLPLPLPTDADAQARLEACDAAPLAAARRPSSISLSQAEISPRGAPQ